MSGAITSTNPATGETLQTFPSHSASDLQDKLARAAQAFRQGLHTPFAERARRLTRAAEILESRKAEWARLMTTEMGKPLRAAEQEAEKCALVCRFYAEHAERMLADEPVQVQGARAWVRFEPMGAVLAVMPWNFPFWQVFRFAAPSLMAGNVGLLKHASNVPGCALAIEQIFSEAGFPDGSFQTLLVGSEQVGTLLDDRRVAAVTLTGSEGAGSSVAERAGKRIKKTVLELGGSDPFVVLPSADLDAAVATAVKARTINNGQSCIAAKRFIVHEAIADRFQERFVAGMQALNVGDPLHPDTDIGPLATRAIRDEVHQQVQRAVDSGARLLCGGRIPDGAGWFYPPTVLTDLAPDAPVTREEVFGPVAMLFRVPDVHEAIRVANDIPFGLGSSVWTRDAGEQEQLVDGIEAGMVFVNAMVASDPRLPFGGVKTSGYGRELGVYGIREFVNVKTVWVADGAGDHRSETE